MKNYLSLADALSDLKQRGYDIDFAAETESVCLYSGELDMRLDPDEFHVDEVYRFDCNAIQDNNSILYAISAPVSGVKGTLVDSIGTFSCNLSFVLASKVNITYINS
ncbi:phosphoribosylpyrophosphate synthetase [Pinibacter aurantiacus]|uniref:Phosphoribosylpyrophosphate synthetase n=1 Tax=Pinibacter aurantiacus TaxID=2851599 RepID=A0A9E2W6Z8_9BACT|nr:phosphoribosylpyrophosphate synthetase [Pinibacter aurantiacus]MBV4355861.1 phosphoribosylpyrophosphate synthetase [Pinibacter aurantiacus]